MSLRGVQSQTVKDSGLSTEHAAAVVVIGALAVLILIRRGFRGVSVGGVSVGVR
jgi:hypothetical protein